MAHPSRAWYRFSVLAWLAAAAMTAAVVYSQLGAGMHWWTAPSHSTYEIENYGFPYIAVMQCWMTELMADDLIPRIEVWDWYPWSLAVDLPLGLLLIASTGVVTERLVRSRGQASLAGILALTATTAALVAVWLRAPALLAWLRTGPRYVMEFNNAVYIDMPLWLRVAWTLGIVCAIDTMVLTAWKIAARGMRLNWRRVSRSPTAKRKIAE